MEKNVKLPKSWELSDQQECVIGSLIDHAGDWVSSEAFTKALYGTPEKPAPAKLRVTMMRCRDIVFEQSNGRVEIDVKRNAGWKLTVRNALILKKFIEKAK
jgi:DNA-binding response OmpR family regulator